MTQQELNSKMEEMVNNRVNDGFNRMKNMPVCEKFYNEMVSLGYQDAADTFKRVVLCTTMLNPEMTDKEIFLNFAKEQNMI